jgi:hypothetical protein
VSFRAIWDIYPTDPVDATNGDNIVVDSPPRVDELVARLGVAGI